jgi:hypothetical protein
MQSFADFWPYYVAEHSKKGTRALHFVGTTIGTMLLIVFIATGRWLWIPLAFVPGYAAAWIGHFFIEHNRPATFKHPLWSFISDYKMVAMMIAGKMEKEVERCCTEKLRA